jgi:hypothetical protein
MGREIRRVALDFKCEIGEVWPGFINNHWRDCPHCQHGYTLAGARLGDLVSLIMLSGDDARRGKAHPYFYDAPLHSTAGRMPPSKDMADLTEGLAGRTPSIMGHDSCDKWSATKKIIAAAGMPKDWGICPQCKGDAVDPAVKEAYEAWTETPPPAGDGYQLWSTTTEGTPMTPVFKTPEELARHCADEGVSSFGRDTASYDVWLKFIQGPGWAPSAVMQNGQMQSGIEAVTDALGKVQ